MAVDIVFDTAAGCNNAIDDVNISPYHWYQGHSYPSNQLHVQAQAPEESTA